MPEYVVGSYIRSPAARRFRLVNFDASFAANGYKLKQRHCEELDKLLQFVSQTTSFSYWLIGFASKTGPAADNQQLSNNRALAVEKYLSARNPAFADPDRLQKFQGVGEAGYQAAETDNSWEYRAVEVHLFIGDVKPPRPPNVRPVPNIVPPLPGGRRYKQWQVAAVFGLQIPTPASLGPLGLQVTVNLFGFKKTDEGEEVHWYVGAGPSAGLSLPAIGALKNLEAVWNIITAPSYSGLSFSDPVTADNPISFGDLHGADASLVQAGGGIHPPPPIPGLPFIPTGYQWARMYVTGKFWKYDPVTKSPTLSHEGEPMLSNMDVGGPQQALGLGAGVQANKLLQIH